MTLKAVDAVKEMHKDRKRAPALHLPPSIPCKTTRSRRAGKWTSVHALQGWRNTRVFLLCIIFKFHDESTIYMYLLPSPSFLMLTNKYGYSTCRRWKRRCQRYTWGFQILIIFWTSYVLVCSYKNSKYREPLKYPSQVLWIRCETIAFSAPVAGRKTQLFNNIFTEHGKVI